MKKTACVDKPLFLCYFNTIPPRGVREEREEVVSNEL